MDTYLLKREEIEAYPGVEKVHFLNPNARRTNKSLGDLTGLQQLGFHLIEIPPGCDSTELHCHYYEEECVYILSGQATATLGEQQYSVGPGDFLGYRAGGLAHKLHNSGTEPLRCLVAGQRLDHDVADYPAQGKRIYRNRDLPWNLVELAAIETPQGGRKV
ncbi:cupin domain-containing protein [Balneatrix alpica]|uniref:cupin domain-containing protein n=1 Tax=Balneatrix alpica TaxID=75684 RepID=UPI002739A449|nr:cupin domain-containing protein [Balneatrix alpica]